MPTREWSPLTTNFQVNAGDSDPRSLPVVGIGHHHTATTSKSGALSAFLPGGRTVTPNYFIAGREIWGIVPENRRAWTSSSRTYDGQSITYEILNSTGDPNWAFTAETLETVAKLDAEISKFYGIPFVHALPGYWEHKNVYVWTGGREGYATACAGPSFNIAARIAQAKALAGNVTPVPDNGDVQARYIFASGRGGLLVKGEVGGIYVPRTAEEAQGLQDTFGGLTRTDRQWDVARQAALNIQADRGEAPGATQAALDAIFQKIAARIDAIDDDLTPDVDEAALAAILVPLIKSAGIEAEVDAAALADVFLNATVERLAS